MPQNEVTQFTSSDVIADTITGTELIETIRDLANRHPDHIAGCTYFQDGKPHCIVGHALHKLSLQVPAQYNGTSFFTLLGYPESTASAEADELRSRLYVTSYDLNWIREVQRNQDQNTNWACSVAAADDSDRWIV